MKGNMKLILAKLMASRKFLAGTLCAFVIMFEKQLGFELSAEQRWALVSLTLGWIGVEGAIDFKAVKREDAVDDTALLKAISEIENGKETKEAGK